MPDVGDEIVPSVDVYDWDDTTGATLTILDPDKLATTGVNPVATLVTVTIDGVPTEVQVQRWTVDPVPLGKPTEWVFIWHVTGNGGGVQSEKVWVEALPEPGGVAWRPTRERVATYIPERTVEVDRQSGGQPVLDFTPDTRPTARQMDQQIEDAVAWVSTACGDLHESLHDTARGLAAIRAAGMAEISWPVQRAQEPDGPQRVPDRRRPGRPGCRRADHARLQLPAAEPVRRPPSLTPARQSKEHSCGHPYRAGHRHRQ
jgi:hypothetical protein